MVKCGAMCFVVMSGLCLVALVMAEEETTVTPSEYSIQGKVHCDTCLVKFITNLSKYIEGAKVRLECRSPSDPKNVLFSKEALTDDEGTYNVTMPADYMFKQCEIVLAQSPDPDCNEIPQDTNFTLAASVAFSSPYTPSEKLAYPIRFLRKTPLAA